MLIVNGATQVWGGDPLQHTANALTAAKALLRPGGKLLLGEGFWERWLRANPDSPHAEDVRAKADRSRNYRLHGWRGAMGLTYATLQAP